MDDKGQKIVRAMYEWVLENDDITDRVSRLKYFIDMIYDDLACDLETTGAGTEIICNLEGISMGVATLLQEDGEEDDE